ncbi:hypothetical protein [Massilia sp. TN1-12]|uniref:hypothetical protein n=1 Tax=Massilia paldalensis TaxID=3377675 RepID=UPI0038506DFA
MNTSITPPVLQTKEQYDDAIRICNVMVDIIPESIGDDPQHPLMPMMESLMNAIGAWEAADPEMQVFFKELAS